MADLEQLKQKYASVLAVIHNRNVRLDHLHVQDNKLFMQGAAPNEETKNEVWTAIKAVDAGYADLTCDLTVDSNIPAPGAATAPTATAAPQTYTVQAGDSLSKIAKHFYGDANRYMTIFHANEDKIKDPNKISAGQELKIPAA